MPVQVKIKENSFVARLAAWKLKANSVAIVFGNTIYLWNVTKQHFLKDERWVLHELEHIRQYSRLGLIPFLFQYMLEWMRKGYYQNRFEVEARQAEKKHGSFDRNEFYFT
ncbi:MAG: DUF4157 domain-containing protein [Chitinophagaceae bacterium]